jgi:hypothetical protein
VQSLTPCPVILKFGNPDTHIRIWQPWHAAARAAEYARLYPMFTGDESKLYRIRLGGEVTFTLSQKRIENWSLNFNAMSLALGAVSFKRGHVLRGGQVPVWMFALIRQSASECCTELGRMPSWPAIKLKKGLFGYFMQTNS